MAPRAERLRKHTNSEMSLQLVREEAMCLEDNLSWQYKTVRVQVSATFKDDNGQEYAATRIIKLRLRKPEVSNEPRILV